MKRASYIKLKHVYEVGEYCGIDGRLWSVLVEDNKDSLKNIKEVLLEHYQKELDILLEEYQGDLDANDYIMLVKGYIDDYKELITKIKSYDNIEQLSYVKLDETYRYILVKKVEVIT